ncbi:hypothetical protein TKK_0019048 [Trichogramma kaykai]
MLSRFSSLKCVAINVSKFIRPRKKTPVFNLLLHTRTANKKPKEGLLPTGESQQNCNTEKKVAVLLTGCGGLDGSEPYEVISLVIYLHYRGFTTEFFAPEHIIKPVMDHNRKKPVEHDHPSAGERYINLEAQRLFHREQDRVQCIDSLIPSNYEALFIPGGQGVINYMLLARGEPFRPPVPTFKNIIERFIADKKPIGTISSGGIVVATVYKMIGYENFYYTMGSRDIKPRLCHSYDAFALSDMLDANHVDKHEGIESSYQFMSTPGMMDSGKVHLPTAFSWIHHLVLCCQHQILSRRPTPYWNRQSCHIPNQTLHNEYQFSTEEPHRLLIGRPPSQKVDSGPRRLSPPKKGKVAVLLNGCGGSDGSNVCETVCLANQLSLFGFSPIFFAPNYLITQNLEGETSSNPSDSQITGMRHSQAEAARLSLRRYVQNVNNLRLGDYLALIIPGSQYYTNYIKCKFGSCKPPLKDDPFIDAIFEAIDIFHRIRKPIGTISSAGLLVAGKLPGVRFTMGEEFDQNLLAHARKAFRLARDWRVQHVNRIVEETSYCTVHNVFSTPGSMSETHTYDKIHRGIAKLVYEISISIENGLDVKND